MLPGIPLDFIFGVPIYVQLLPLILLVIGVLCLAWVVEAARSKFGKESTLSVFLQFIGVVMIFVVAFVVYMMLRTDVDLQDSLGLGVLLSFWLPLPAPLNEFPVMYYFSLIWQYRYYLYIDAAWTYGILIGSTIWISRKYIWEVIKYLALYLVGLVGLVIGFLAGAYYYNWYQQNNLPTLIFTTLLTLIITLDPMLTLIVFNALSSNLFWQALPWAIAVGIGAIVVFGLIVGGIYHVSALIVNFLRSTKVGQFIEKGVSILISLSVAAITLTQAYLLQTGGSISTFFTPYSAWILLLALF